MAKNETKKSPFDAMAEDLAKNVIERFSSVSNWKKGWEESYNQEPPYNAITGAKYKGFNAIALLASAQNNHFDDPRWLTFNQARTANYSVKKGSIGTKIGFFKLDPVDDKTFIPKGLRLPYQAKQSIKTALNKEGIKTWGDLRGKDNPGDYVDKITGLKYKNAINYLLSDIDRGEAVEITFRNYTVFNGNQIEGLPELDKKPSVRETDKSSGALIDKVENIIDNSGVTLLFDDGYNPAYRPRVDTIVMPNPNKFDNVYEYYSTFAHELTHSSLHQERLNITMPSYASEELVAEFSSMLISSETGLKMSQAHFDNHAAYLKSWSEDISDNPRELLNVVRDAGKAAEYVLNLANEKDKYVNPDRAKFNDKNITEDFKQLQGKLSMLSKQSKMPSLEAAQMINDMRMKGIQKSPAKAQEADLEP